MGTSFHGGLGEGSYARGLCVDKVLGRVSLHIGAPLGDLGKGVHLPGTLRDGRRGL